MTCGLTVASETSVKYGVYQKDSIVADCFGPFDIRQTKWDGSTNFNCPGKVDLWEVVCRNQENGVFFIPGGGFTAELLQDFENLEIVDLVTADKANYRHKLIFGGRIGNAVKVVYQEFSGDLAYPVLEQELQFDVAESSVISFKNLEMRVDSVNNEKITFTVIRGFYPK